MNQKSNILVVGCGLKPRPGATNLDRFELPGVNCVFDLNRVGHCHLPLPAESFDRVEAGDVLEHVIDIVSVVNDLWRVLKPGGSLWIRGPHWNHPEQLWSDPTHLRAFANRSFDGWDRSTWDGKEYGHYFHQGKFFFRVVDRKEVNKGMEFILIKELP